DWPGAKGSGKSGFRGRDLSFIYALPGRGATWNVARPFYVPAHEIQEFLPIFDYGYVAPWILAPFGGLAAPWLLVPRRGPPLAWIAPAAGLGTFLAMRTPLYARYHILLIAALALALAHVLDAWPRLGRHLAGAAALAAVATLALADRPALVTPDVAWRMASTP